MEGEWRNKMGRRMGRQDCVDSLVNYIHFLDASRRDWTCSEKDQQTV